MSIEDKINFIFWYAACQTIMVILAGVLKLLSNYLEKKAND
jgi:hypothetical protein